MRPRERTSDLMHLFHAASYFIFANGLLKPPRRFMYCRHVRCLWTLAVSSSFCPLYLPYSVSVICAL